ncbi:type III CRISPR-associated RAMP protein Csx7 [Dapis sp. BLCC M126]|uniref:type III CRISPR-associated RAMP protein Csx7 n=1 Tax=Dapis sp. BLCC M126 TaxID=3400189 RepID=UPI003CE9F392
MFDTFKNRLEIEGKLTTVTALRIGAARSTEPIGSDLPVVKDVLGQPLIPGSSFKGALRSRLESFLRGILGSNPRLVANPAVNEEWCITAERMKKLKAEYTNDAQLTEAILKKTDLISHLFGSPWVASKFQVRDLTVLPDNWFGQYQERDGVAIDRDTETAADGKLYDFQVVPGGTPFLFKAVVENAEDWELGLLMVGLHQFETEQIPLGGGRSRGLGVVKLEIEKMNWFDARKEGELTKTDPQKLIGYLKQLVGDQTPAFDDGKELKDDWVKALIDRLEQKVSTTAEVESKQNL